MSMAGASLSKCFLEWDSTWRRRFTSAGQCRTPFSSSASWDRCSCTLRGHGRRLRASNPHTENHPRRSRRLSFIRERIKWALFPGFNLHARQRFHELPDLLAVGRNGRERLVLDAGCGNGMLSYASHRLGDRVIGISIKEGEIARNKRLFNQFMGIAQERVEFRVHNLHDLQALGMQFDAIVCTEVMEHISDDTGLCRSFWQILKPGGTLHITSPNADHPDNRGEKIDPEERGGHVRAGYT